MTINRITQNNAVPAIPKGDGIKENSLPCLLIHLLPTLSAIQRAIDACLALFRRTRADDNCRVCIEGVNASEIELLRARHFDHGPVTAAINGSDHGAFRTTGPNDFSADNAQPAKAGGGTNRDTRLGACGSDKQQCKKEFHAQQAITAQQDRCHPRAMPMNRSRFIASTQRYRFPIPVYCCSGSRCRTEWPPYLRRIRASLRWRCWFPDCCWRAGPLPAVRCLLTPWRMA